MKVVSVYGTAAPRGRLGQLEETAYSLLVEEFDCTVTRVDLHATPLDFAEGRALDGLSPSTAQVVSTVEAADVVLVFSPIYKGGIPGSLKNMFDLLGADGLAGAVLACVAMGHSMHHFFAADGDLRRLGVWFGAHVAPTTLYVTPADVPGLAKGGGTYQRLHGYLSSTLAYSSNVKDVPVQPVPLPQAGKQAAG